MKQKEGYLMIDDRCSGGPQQEMKTYTCTHCHAVIVMNPQRTRERGYCRGCDSWICDACTAIRAVTGQCRTFDQIVDEALNVILRT